MDKATVVKIDIQFILSQNLGVRVGESFHDAYRDATLPIYVENAQTVLEDLIGKQKAKDEIKSILTRHNMANSLS